MKPSRASLEWEAERSGFRVEVLEKVCRLQRLLAGFGRHPFLKERVVLKGGTALNLFFSDLPRLSVDIDLNYIGKIDRDATRTDRPRVEQAVRDVCGREAVQVIRAPKDHAGGKWRLRYSSALGGNASLEVDLNFMHRVPLWPPVRRDGPRLAGIQAKRVAVLDIHELAAGKLTALFARRASRDLFDAHSLLGREDIDDGRLRTAFLVYGGMSRMDWRGIRVSDIGIEARQLRNELAPTLRRNVVLEQGAVEEWAHRLLRECQRALRRVLPFNPAERQFLDGLLDQGELRPELLTRDADLAARIAAHPGLLWKAQNVRKHRGR